MKRIQRARTSTALAAVTAVAVALVGFSMSGVGAQEPVIEIHRSSSANFEGFPDGPVFIAIVGTDDRPGVSGARADAIHVIGVNRELGKGTMLNIPRDTWTNLPGHGTRKINESHTRGGAALVGETLTALTGAPVSYVVTTNFEGFTNLVNEMGGIPVDMPYAVNDAAAAAIIPAGQHNLTGNAALALARARKSVPGGDFGRTENQGRMLLGALQQLQERQPRPPETIRLVAGLMRHLRTTSGIDAAELYKLGRLALEFQPGDIASVTMPGSTGSAGGASVVFPTAQAQAVFADFRDDGVLQNPPG